MKGLKNRLLKGERDHENSILKMNDIIFFPKEIIIQHLLEIK